MAITRIKNSSIASNGPKYDNALAGLPYRPIIGTATDGGTGTTVSVAFTANNVAGAGVTYTALSSPGSLTGTGSASPITVSGLTSGTAYTFQVKAGNSLGDSAYSASSNSVTPVQPTAFESIATATGTGSSGVITFSSIPTDFVHLQIRGISRSTQAVTGFRDINIRCNSDSGANYATHNARGTGAVTAGQDITATTAMLAFRSSCGDSNPSGVLGAVIIDILDYRSTSKYKTMRAFGGSNANNTTGDSSLSSGMWMSTSAITSIELRTALDNWTTSTTFALYGIKGSA